MNRFRSIMEDHSGGYCSTGCGDGEENICGAVIMLDQDPRRNERGSERTDAPGKVEQCEQRCATFGESATGEECHRRHGHANADSQEEEDRLEKWARAERHRNAGGSHPQKPECHGTRIVPSAKQRSDRRTSEVEKKQQTGV